MFCASHTRSRRGNVFIATMGTLAVLMIVVMAAANSTQMTWNTTAIAMQDSRLRAALSEAAVLVQARPDVVAGPSAAPATEATTETAGLRTIIPAAQGSKQVTVLAAPEPIESIPPEIERLAGDSAVLLQARPISGKGNSRAATYLMNTQGQRPSPILVSERRM